MSVKHVYIVTTRSSQGALRTQLWNTLAPLPIGHPFQWVMERTPAGLRVRSLSNQRDEIRAANLQEIPGSVADKGAEFELPCGPGRKPVSIRVRPAIALRPMFETSPVPVAGDLLHIYACAGHWVIESAAIGDRYVARYHRKTAFVIEKSGGSYAIRAKLPGINLIRSGQPPSILAADQPQANATTITMEDLVATSLSYEGRIWRFGAAREHAVPMPIPGALPKDTNGEDTETRWFRKALAYTGASVALLVAIALLIPWAPEEEPLDAIPPQIAKLVFQHPQPASASQQASPEATVAKVVAEAPKKVQQTAVVQAFRAKALQSAMSGLLKGGMARLLAQSDFAVGTNASLQARKIFDSKSDVLKSTAPDIGFDTSHSTMVASIGGASLSDPGSKGTVKGSVGYGKGNRASLKGQGETMVSMDIAAASVEEGLSKDEVGAIIHKHLSEVRYCYESAMLRTPDIEGKLMMSFVIGGNGSVKTSEVKSSTLPDPRLDDCVLRRLVTWQFPTPKGGVEVAVSYPFIFKTLGR